MRLRLDTLDMPFTRAQARAIGATDRQLDRRLANGELLVVRRGLLAPRRQLDQLPAPARHGVFVRAAMARVDVPTWASHASAAVLLGLPVPRSWTDQVVVTAQHAATVPRYYPGLTVEVASLDTADVTVHSGIAMTRPARTVIDCLRHLPTWDALAIGDAALRRGLVDPTSLLRVLDRCTGWPFAERAHHRLPLLDGRRESPLESWSAGVWDELGIEQPEPQVTLYDDRGCFVARVDDYWEAWGVVGEADGWSKYELGVDGAREPLDPEALERRQRERLRREKRRQDSISDLGLEIVRWTTADLYDGKDLVRRVLAARARADPRRFTGTAVRSSRPGSVHLLAQATETRGPNGGLGE